jgi:hypothetical protein
MLYVLVKSFINLEMIFLSCEPNIDDDLPGVFCFLDGSSRIDFPSDRDRSTPRSRTQTRGRRWPAHTDDPKQRAESGALNHRERCV